SVALAGIEQIAEQIRAEGGTACAIACDVSQTESVEALVERTLAEFSRVDFLVNSAGMQGAIEWIVDYDPVEWDRIMAVNLRGPFLCCKAVLPGMIERR